MMQMRLFFSSDSGARDFRHGLLHGSSRVALACMLLASTLHAIAATLTVRVSDTNGLPALDTAVFATATNTKPAARPPAKAAIDQVNKEFVPVLSVIQAGTSVVFPNRDNIRHHVYSFSPAKMFELKLYSGQPAAPVIFDKPGIVVLGCNIHDWMISYVVVVDTPYFGKTDASGAIRLDDVPPGEYELKIWHYRASFPNEMTATRKPIVAPAGTTADFTVTLTGSAVGGVAGAIGAK